MQQFLSVENLCDQIEIGECPLESKGLILLMVDTISLKKVKKSIDERPIALYAS